MKNIVIISNKQHIQVHQKKKWISWKNDIFSLISESETHILYRFITEAFISWNIDDYGLQIMKTPNERKLEYNKINKKKYFKQNCQASEKYVHLLHMYSILGWASFCMNYCINAAWQGGDQPVALLRCNGSPGCSDSGLQVICIVGSGVSHLPLDNTPYILYGVQVRRVCWPIKHSNTMAIEPAFGTFGSVGRCQVLLENEISISIKLVSSRKHEVL